MPKRLRLDRAEIEAILSQRPRRIHGALFSLVYAPVKPNETGKYACVVSKKVANKAVDRNRIRRRCYSVLRRNQDTIQPGLHVLLYAKKEACHSTFQSFETGLLRLIQMFRA